MTLKRTNLVRVAGTLGFLMLPVLGSAAGDLCYLRDAAAPSTTNAYLLCEQGIVYATTDGGANWKMFRTGAQATLHTIAFKDDLHGYVAGDSGTILVTDDGAKTWRAVTDQKGQNFTREHLLSLYAIGDQAWAGGFDGALLHSTDAGRTWARQDSTTTMAIQGLYFLDQDHGWAAGWSGTILRTADGGQKWEAIKTSASTWSLNGIYFRDLKDGWAVGFDGELLRSRDGGTTWEAQKSPVQANLGSVRFDKAGRAWIAADEQLLVSQDDGNTWQVAPVNSNLFLSKVFGRGDSLWALGELGLLKQAPDGLQWKRETNMVPVGTFIPDSLEGPTSTVATAGSTPAASTSK